MSTIVQTLQSIPRKLAGARVGIPPRQVRFLFKREAPRYYVFDESPVATNLFVTLSGIFPPGERFFVESVRRFREQITDETLKAQIAGFIGQEAIHGREHERLNAYHRERNLDARVPDRMVRAGLWALSHLSDSQQLACTAFMEHATAALAEEWLTNEKLQKTSDPELMQLWYWHALEELEHKAVTYDVWKQVSGNDHERTMAMALVLTVIIPPIFVAWTMLLVRDGQLLKVRENRDAVRFLFKKKGFLHNVFRAMPAFIGEGFHPSKHSTKALEELWREKLFGAQGELRQYASNLEHCAV